MMTSAVIENFRGLERARVNGFSRVNLITGKNDCGKTALMEAVSIATVPQRALYHVRAMQQARGLNRPRGSFNTSWGSIFRGGDAKRGFSIEARGDNGVRTALKVWKKETDSVVLPEGEGTTQDAEPDWMLASRCDVDGATTETEARGTEKGVQITGPSRPGGGDFVWIEPFPNVSDMDLEEFSHLKQSGRESAVVAMLRLVDPSIDSVDILAPGGRAMLFVKRRDEPIMLPLQVMGDGLQRCVEISVVLSATEGHFVFIDEVENGLHHSVHETLWRWIAQVAKERNVQVFATTHSEECVFAASRAFKALDDDGLRVIRLDRHEHETTSAGYDRDLVIAAEEMGIEIRG